MLAYGPRRVNRTDGPLVSLTLSDMLLYDTVMLNRG